MEENINRTLLEQFFKGLSDILLEVKEAQREPAANLDVNLKAFFDFVRKPLFRGRLQASQVSGMEAKLRSFKESGMPLSHAAYAMATSYHETATRMQPVREGLNASDAWRKKNLRYYPWYGRGDVQLTWRDNYVKMEKELGLGGAMIDAPDTALDPDISAKVITIGMTKGMFSKDKQGVPHTLKRHLPNTKGTRAQFKQARRIVNLMDKADTIAGYALIFQDALEEAGY